jgi:pimeloyl-ACP methyl ester carboxylesterase
VGSSVLLLPGSMGTAAFYDDVLADPRVAASGHHWVADTPPGFGGRPLAPGFTPTVESYATLTAARVAELGSDVVVGHSYFANVLLELVVSGCFAGRVAVLLSPSFAAADEEVGTRMLGRLSRVPAVGPLAWAIACRMLPLGLKGRVAESRRAELVAEMQRVDRDVARQMLVHHLDHLAAHPALSLAERLAASHTRTWVVRGEGDEVGLSGPSRQILESAPKVELVTVPDARHFVMVDQPAAVVEVVLQALASLGPGPEDPDVSSRSSPSRPGTSRSRPG